MWVSKETVQAMREQIEKLNRALKEAENRTVLIDIERTGKKNKFIFVRNRKVHTIRTVGLLSDDVKGWKDQLLK